MQIAGPRFHEQLEHVEGDGPGKSAHDVVTAADTLGTLWLSAIGLSG